MQYKSDLDLREAVSQNRKKSVEYSTIGANCGKGKERKKLFTFLDNFFKSLENKN